MDNSNLGSQTLVLKTQKASLHYCTRPTKNVFCTVEWTKTGPRLFDAMICQIHLHSAKIYLNWGYKTLLGLFYANAVHSALEFKKKCGKQCRHKNKGIIVGQDAHFSPAKYTLIWSGHVVTLIWREHVYTMMMQKNVLQVNCYALKQYC
jgi:hypothetical protein